jgi:hypothetical protein
MRLILITFFTSLLSISSDWIKEESALGVYLFTDSDKENMEVYKPMVQAGVETVQVFFKKPYPSKFDIYVHPNRQSLDKQWQKDWNMPTFKSECWMVASGVANKLDIISPMRWETEACEHRFVDKIKTQQVITHELFHVYHGQLNPSPDFSQVEGIDWLVEGFATYASGQCDASRIGEVKKALSENKIPTSLDNFWSGKLRYGLSGSVVQYIDQKIGRDRLITLLSLTKKAEVLASLQTSEEELLKGWRQYIQGI